MVGIGIVIGIWGLLIGSFLNVCIYRIPRGQSIVLPPSHCPACNQRLKPLDLIPVISYLAFGRRCRYCGKMIRSRYMWVELLTGGLFVLTYWVYGLSIVLIPYWTLTAILIIAALIDMEHRIIPNGLNLFGGICGLAWVLLHWVPNMESTYVGNVVEALIGLMAGVLPLILMNLLGKWIFKRDGMGSGDMKLMAAVGLYLGWELTLTAILLAVYLGAIFGVTFLIIRRRSQSSNDDGELPSGHEIAFGPFLALGSYLAMHFGETLIQWYVTIIT